MSVISELAELAELRVYQAVFKPDKSTSVRLNVRLFSVEETETILKRAGADPVNLMAESFLDPNTGEKVFTREILNKYPKLLLNKLVDFYFDVNFGRYKEEDR